MKNKLLAVSILVTLTLVVVFYAYAQESTDQNTVMIVNNTDVEFQSVYISVASDDNWGQNQLPQSKLEPAAGFNFTYGSDCLYDFKGVDEDGVVYYQWDLDICDQKYVLFDYVDIDYEAEDAPQAAQPPPERGGGIQN